MMNNTSSIIADVERLALLQVLSGNDPNTLIISTGKMLYNTISQKFGAFQQKLPNIVGKCGNGLGGIFNQLRDKKDLKTKVKHKSREVILEAQSSAIDHKIAFEQKEQTVKNVMNVVTKRISYRDGHVQYDPLKGKVFDDLNDAVNDIVKSMNAAVVDGKITLYDKEIQKQFNDYIEEQNSNAIGWLTRIVRWTMEKSIELVNYICDVISCPEDKIKTVIKVPSIIKKNSSFADRMRVEALELKTQSELLR